MEKTEDLCYDRGKHLCIDICLKEGEDIVAMMDARQNGKRTSSEAREKRKKKNRRLLRKVPYHYVYTPDSAVFHRKECPLILGAKTIVGSVYYATAAQKRRPCKVCCPQPDHLRGVPPPTDPEGREDRPERLREVVSARMLGGEVISIRRGKIVGCCHNRIHWGKMTGKMLEEHDCIGKQCSFFEKYEESTYWKNAARKEKKKAEAKAIRKEEKARRLAIEEDLRKKEELLRSYLQECGYTMEIIRVKEERNRCYKVFYVSENRFADGDRFPEFLRIVRERHPRWRIILRHIRDLDGHFMTIEEFRAVKK